MAQVTLSLFACTPSVEFSEIESFICLTPDVLTQPPKLPHVLPKKIQISSLQNYHCSLIIGIYCDPVLDKRWEFGRIIINLGCCHNFLYVTELYTYHLIHSMQILWFIMEWILHKLVFLTDSLLCALVIPQSLTRPVPLKYRSQVFSPAFLL